VILEVPVANPALLGQAAGWRKRTFCCDSRKLIHRRDMIDTPNATVTPFAVEEDALAKKPATSISNDRVHDALPAPPVETEWDEIQGLLYTSKPLTLAQVAIAADHLPPLTKQQCEEMGMPLVYEYAGKVFRLVGKATKSLYVWMKSHWEMMQAMHDDAVVHQGHRFPIPGFKDWKEIKRECFPDFSSSHIDHIYGKLLAEMAGETQAGEEARAAEGRKKNKKKNEKPAEPTPTADKPDTSYWDGELKDKPAPEMTAIIHAALKHNDYDYAYVTSPLDFTARMKLLAQVLKDLGCDKSWINKCRSLVYEARRDAEAKRKSKKQHKQALKKYEAEASARENARKHSTKHDAKQPKPKQPAVATQQFPNEMTVDDKPQQEAQPAQAPTKRERRKNQFRNHKKTSQAKAGGNGGGDGGVVAPPVPQPDPRSLVGSNLEDRVRIENIPDNA
jgi:hypothetical protein